MRRDNQSLRFIAGCAVVLLSLACFASTNLAQTAIGAPPIRADQPHPSFGFEIGIGQHTLDGGFPIGANISGTGFVGSIFYELPLSDNVSWGMKGMIDFKNASSITTYQGAGVGTGNTGMLDTAVPMPVNDIETVTMTLLRFEPYLQFRILHSAFFINIGAGFSYLLTGDSKNEWTIATNSVSMADGSTVSDLTFPNGARSNAFAGHPVNEGLLISMLLSAGYNIELFGTTVEPMITYDSPLSGMGWANYWNITSLYGSVAVKFKL